MPPPTDTIVGQAKATPTQKGQSLPMHLTYSSAYHLRAGKGSLQRRGPKGRFKGSKRLYLESHLSEYVASKKGNRQNFWHKVYSGWWERFPWKLEDDEEPPTDDPVEMARLAEVAPGEEAQKEVVEKSLQEVCYSVKFFGVVARVIDPCISAFKNLVWKPRFG